MPERMSDEQIRDTLAEMKPKEQYYGFELFYDSIKNESTPQAHATRKALRLLAECWQALGEIEGKLEFLFPMIGAFEPNDRETHVACKAVVESIDANLKSVLAIARRVKERK